jgi:hypothetical protein
MTDDDGQELTIEIPGGGARVGPFMARPREGRGVEGANEVSDGNAESAGEACDCGHIGVDGCSYRCP